MSWSARSTSASSVPVMRTRIGSAVGLGAAVPARSRTGRTDRRRAPDREARPPTRTLRRQASGAAARRAGSIDLDGGTRARRGLQLRSRSAAPLTLRFIDLPPYATQRTPAHLNGVVRPGQQRGGDGAGMGLLRAADGRRVVSRPVLRMPRERRSPTGRSPRARAAAGAGSVEGVGAPRRRCAGRVITIRLTGRIGGPSAWSVGTVDVCGFSGSHPGAGAGGALGRSGARIAVSGHEKAGPREADRLSGEGFWLRGQDLNL